MKGFFRKYGAWIVVIVLLVLANVLVRVRVFRWDMTDDKIYSLSEASKELLRQTDAPIEVTLLLDGDLGPGFGQLRSAFLETIEEMRSYARDIRVSYLNLNEASESVQRAYAERGVQQYAQETTSHSGRTEIINTFPYALVQYKDKERLVQLFTRTLGSSETEDLNRAISQLEFTLMEAVHQLRQSHTPTIAIYSGQQGVPERYTQDLEKALQPYFRIKRVSINPAQMNVHVFDSYQAVIIANPQTKFNEVERFIIDQYIMRGGAVLWAVDRVKFSDDMLRSDGFTPLTENDLGLWDLLFSYGLRIEPMLVQSVQCMSIRVNVSADPSVPNLQLVPWTFAPQLLPNPENPVTAPMRSIVSSMFVSPISVVGGNDGIEKVSLLVTSNGSKLTHAPNEVNLNELNPDLQSFIYPNMPIAASLEGSFRSAYAHRMTPEGVITDEPIRKQGKTTRQVVIGSGSMVINEIEGGQPIPLGFDRASGIQYGNRDFIINSMLWLTHTEDLIPLRAKGGATLRPLNKTRAYSERTKIEKISTISPIVLLALIGGVVLIIRRMKYASKKVKR
ncbi:MAG: gliding motility-associated ABC transporter substrate-binding protein GldG [Paludibacteraceae bacterium]|nr:gliding motility-associated ABC transporter substrate-binding protein GldG [Paludibacteraceae bacterium]